MSDITKLYASYKAGYLGNNILDTYFSFIANIIINKDLTTIEDTQIADEFKKKYAIDLPLSFVRQVLGVGVRNNCFIEDHGKYSINIDEIKKYEFQENDFNKLWSLLISEFESYCRKIDVDIASVNTNDFILDILDDSDEKILSGERVENTSGISPIQFAWYSFVKEQGETKSDLYSFITAISASNITKQALFYAGETPTDYLGLNVYLDSPIVFALLGMDEPSRTESYRTLIRDMQDANCNVRILDHNYQEVDSIIASASIWATSTQYDLNKANNAARFFHDSGMSEEEISDFCESIETKINELGITIKETDYDVYQNQFQEDEETLFNMVKERYSDQGYNLAIEKEDSIRIDVRSIVMVYRERQGQTSTRIQNSKHLMLTSNNAIANVSKKYESNKSLNSGHIPACVSADLFGAILWLNSPLQMLEYQKEKLLADCYSFLKPDKAMVGKYIQSLEDARNADEIDEKKFLFLRTHKVVLDSLMNITKGDYARFDSKTYIEVYDDIQSKSQKMYRDEALAHEQTKQELKQVKDDASKDREKAEQDKEKSQQAIEQLNKKISDMEEKERLRLEKQFQIKVSVFGWLFTLIVAGIPYVISLVILELCKSQFTKWTHESIIYIAVIIILTFIIAALFKRMKSLIFKIVEKVLLWHKDK